MKLTSSFKNCYCRDGFQRPQPQKVERPQSKETKVKSVHPEELGPTRSLLAIVKTRKLPERGVLLVLHQDSVEYEVVPLLTVDSLGLGDVDAKTLKEKGYTVDLQNLGNYREFR